MVPPFGCEAPASKPEQGLKHFTTKLKSGFLTPSQNECQGNFKDWKGQDLEKAPQGAIGPILFMGHVMFYFIPFPSHVIENDLKPSPASGDTRHLKTIRTP